MSLRNRVVSVSLWHEFDDQAEESEVTVTCYFTPGYKPYYDISFGNYLPGEPPNFEWGGWMVGGLMASEDMIKKIENNEKLMVRFEEKIIDLLND